MFKLRKSFSSKTLKKALIKNNLISHQLPLNPTKSQNLKQTKTVSSNKSSINQKSFLEILLGLIKISQEDIISSSKTNLKKILTTLKENLISISTEQSMEEKYYSDKINKIKVILHEKIFGNTKIEEITKFKNLNFEIENNINTVDYMIENKKKTLNRIKLLDFMPEENKEIFLGQQTNLQKNLTNLMYNSLIKKTEKLCILITAKRRNDREIKNLENIINDEKKLQKSEEFNFQKIPEISKQFVKDKIEEEKITIYKNEYNATAIHENLNKNYECIDGKCVSCLGI